MESRRHKGLRTGKRDGFGQEKKRIDASSAPLAVVLKALRIFTGKEEDSSRGMFRTGPEKSPSGGEMERAIKGGGARARYGRARLVFEGS